MAAIFAPLLFKIGDGVYMKGYQYLSVICGILFAVLSYFLLRAVIPEDAAILSVLAGFLFGMLLFLALLIYDKWINRKYSEFERTIQSPIFYKTSGNFNLGNGVRNGRIYFCENGIVCASLDEKPLAVEVLPLQNIERYEFDPVHMNIYVDDGRMFLITTSDAHEIPEILKSREWTQ